MNYAVIVIGDNPEEQLKAHQIHHCDYVPTDGTPINVQCLGNMESGFFKLKEGITDSMYVRNGREYPVSNTTYNQFYYTKREGYADQALRGQIDFAGMVESRAQRAGELYDIIFNLFDNGNFPLSQKEIQARHPDDKYAIARYYYDQEAFRDNEFHHYWGVKACGIEYFCLNQPNGREIFMSKMRDSFSIGRSSIQPVNDPVFLYAILNDGVLNSSWEYMDFDNLGYSTEKYESWSSEAMNTLTDLPDDILVGYYGIDFNV